MLAGPVHPALAPGLATTHAVARRGLQKLGPGIGKGFTNREGFTPSGVSLPAGYGIAKG